MKVSDVLAPDLIQCDFPGVSKKRLLQNIAHFITEKLGGNLDQEKSMFDNLVAREKLGSTGIGKGVAIPHCRATGMRRIHGCLIKLREPIDFDALDDQPVDLVFALIVPEEKNDEHLATLASIASLLQSQSNLDALRGCHSASELFDTTIKLERSG